MVERRATGTGTFAGLAVVTMAACCGLPLLLSLGASATIAGFGLGSWVLTIVGLVTAVIGVVRFRRRRPCPPE